MRLNLFFVRSAALAVLAGGAFSAIAAEPDVGYPQATASLHGDAARPAEVGGWVRSELYFGVGEEANETAGQPVLGEAEWRAFLDAEVTPRFPDGLSVFDAYGQWLFRGNSEPNRLASKVLVILHENTAQRRNDIEAIRLAWKQASGHQSVLWSFSPVDVSF